MVTVDQRENLLVLLKFLHEETDADHPMTRRAIQRRLDSQGYKIARKQFNSDIALMQKLGMDIVVIERANGNTYYWGKRLFETDELQLLADSVTSSKYLTEQKTQDMIRRLAALTSRFQAEMLRKNICMTSHVKSMDDSILVNVGVIHRSSDFFNFSNESRNEQIEWEQTEAVIVEFQSCFADIENIFIIEMLRKIKQHLSFF